MKNTSKAFSNLMFILTVKTISLNTIDNWHTVWSGGMVLWARTHFTFIQLCMDKSRESSN